MGFPQTEECDLRRSIPPIIGKWVQGIYSAKPENQSGGLERHRLNHLRTCTLANGKLWIASLQRFSDTILTPLHAYLEIANLPMSETTTAEVLLAVRQWDGMNVTCRLAFIRSDLDMDLEVRIR